MPNNHDITAFVAIGTNLGDRIQNIQLAVEKLNHTPGVKIVKIAKPLDNPAVGMGEQVAPFLNSAAQIQTTLGSHTLLHCLLAIEREMGRQRRAKWEPRVIDLDLLFYGDHIISSQELIVPHPLLHERHFVLAPLAEIAPDFVHPTLQMTIAGLLENLSRSQSKTD